MRDKLSVAELPINASPVADHRRQMLRQVWAPLFISLFVVLALMILTIVGAVNANPQVEHWGGISAILIIIPLLLVLLVFLAITGACIYGMTKLLKRMPDWMLRLQLLLVRVSVAVRRGADAATQPVIKVNMFSARVKRLWNRVFRKR